jgi:hypothetical protein
MRSSARSLSPALVLAFCICGLAQQSATRPETAIRGWLSDASCAHLHDSVEIT